MTNEEAIRIIKIVLAIAEDFEITVQGEEFTEEKCKEAVEIVTKALGQQPCENCISREAVVNWLEVCTDDSIEHAIESNLEFIPSVTPQTRWIPCSERLPERVEWYLTSIKWDDGTERVTISWFDGISFKAEVIAWMPLPQPYEAESEDKEWKN